jgi:hypothetical protein
MIVILFLIIGIGFNLDRSAACQCIERLGLNYHDVKEGKVGLTNSHIEQLFETDLDAAINDANMPDCVS